MIGPPNDSQVQAGSPISLEPADTSGNYPLSDLTGLNRTHMHAFLKSTSQALWLGGEAGEELRISQGRSD